MEVSTYHTPNRLIFFLFSVLLTAPWSLKALGDEFDPPPSMPPGLDGPPSQFLDPMDDQSSSSDIAPAPGGDEISDNGPSSGSEDGRSAKKKSSDFQENRTAPETLYKEPPPKAFTSSEIQSTIKQWSGKVVSYFKDVYQLNADGSRTKLKEVEIKRMTVEGRKITNLDDGKILSAFRLLGGRPEEDAINILKQKPKTCQDMKQKYVTISGNTFFFVDAQCVRSPFPDTFTYENHRDKNKKSFADLLIVDEQDLARVTKLGPEMPSFSPKEGLFSTTDAEPKRLPIAEACQGLLGKVVSIYQNLYTVAADPKSTAKGACVLQKLNAELQTRKGSSGKPIELSSSQAVTIPVR